MGSSVELEDYVSEESRRYQYRLDDLCLYGSLQVSPDMMNTSDSLF